MSSQPEQPQAAPAPKRKALTAVPALDLPLVPFAIGGMALWAVVGLTLLAFHDSLAEHGHTNWLWICLAGFLTGIPGLLVMRRHDANRLAGLANPTEPKPAGL